MAVGILWPNGSPYRGPFAKDAGMRIGSKCSLSQSAKQENCQKFLNNWKFSEYLVSAAGLQMALVNVIWACHLHWMETSSSAKNCVELQVQILCLQEEWGGGEGWGGGRAVRVHGNDKRGGSSPCVNQQQAATGTHAQHKKVQDGGGGDGLGNRRKYAGEKLHVSWVLWVCAC